MQIVSGGETTVGRVRTNNEASFRIVAAMNLFILSDGRGGEAHGEIASAMAVESIAKHSAETEVDPALTIFAAWPSAGVAAIALTWDRSRGSAWPARARCALADVIVRMIVA